MIFQFKWYHNEVIGGKQMNQWFTNTFRKWDDKIEKRIEFLKSYGIKIVWIRAELD